MERQSACQFHLRDSELRRLEERIQELVLCQREDDKTLAHLKREKLKLLECLPVEDKLSLYDKIPHFSHILPLVEDVYWLELKEKEMKQEYEKTLLSSEARCLGQQFFTATVSSDECVLKTWFEELTKLKEQQPDLLNLPTGKKKSCSVHNIAFKTDYTAGKFVENLSFTVLCETVQVGVKLTSSLLCANKHRISLSKASLNLFSDTYIPDLEEKAILSLQNGSSVSTVISHIGTHIKNEIAPYVIGLPLKKLKKKKGVKSFQTPDSQMDDIY